MNQKLASIQGNLHELLAKNKTKPLIHPDLSIRFFELSFDALLATGTMGKVYAGWWLEQPVAVKMIEMPLSNEERKDFAREVALMSRLHNRYITQLYGACIEPDRACMIMEYLECGSLHQAIPNFYATPEETHQMILDLARGLYYLHQRGVWHLNFNSKNLLLNRANQVKITDFGFSKVRAQSIQTLGGDRKAELAWMAPEQCVREAAVTPATDVYGLGVVMWELLTRRHPFEGLSDATIITRITNGEREAIPTRVPDFYAGLIEQCWMPDPSDRPELLEIIRQCESHQPERTMTLRPPSPTAEGYYQQGLAYERMKCYPEATQAYQSAVEKGHHTKANTNLASFFHRGVGMTGPNKQEAYQRYLQSAKDNHSRAQYNLARMLEKGDGVPKDLEQAKRWYQEAAKNGNTKATERLNHLSSNSNPTLRS